MLETEISYILVVVLFAIAALLVLLRAFKLPVNFYKKELERDALRKQVIKKNMMVDDDDKKQL